MNKIHESIHKLVEEKEPNICEITVIRDNKKIYEDYWHGYKKDDALNVMSVTKSIVALLTGIAIDRGYIKGVDEKVISFFPDYVTKRGEKTIYDVTIRHLLTMTAPYKYKSEPWTRVCSSGDWTKEALDLLGGRNGITNEFKYATLGIQIMNGILESATGEPVISFANQNLFEPLGIPEVKLHGESDKDDQFNYLMNKNPRIHEWYNDPKDAVTAGWGISLSATDLAKIGSMLANWGEYEGKQILSREWISQMTTPYQTLGETFGYMSYGYLWWIPHIEKGIFAAIGDGGNVIYVNPSKKLAVGVAATFKPRIFDRVDFIEKEILKLLDFKV